MPRQLAFSEDEQLFLTNEFDILLFLGYTWTAIATYLNVSRATIYVYKTYIGYVERLVRIDDETLDAMVTSFIVNHPETGAVMLRGEFQVHGIKVSRDRILESLRRVDGEGVERRKKQCIKRRIYRVANALALVHIDGHHKLIKRFHLVIHGAIDGFSRLCHFIQCVDNNRARTVMDGFERGVAEFGCPNRFFTDNGYLSFPSRSFSHMTFRVRADKGGENLLVGEYMIRTQGENRGSFLTGRSVHNQRIERFWVDVGKVEHYYLDLFQFFVDELNVDFDLDGHVFVIHYLFIPQINQSLRNFQLSWNAHKVSTEHNKSPEQLFYNSVIVVQPDQPIEDDYGAENEEENDNAVADDARYALRGDDDYMDFREAVRLDPLRCPLNEEQFMFFCSRVTPISLDIAHREDIVPLVHDAFLWFDNACNY